MEVIYTKVIPATKAKPLMGIMQDRIVLDSIVYTDTFQSYAMLDAPDSSTIASTILSVS